MHQNNIFNISLGKNFLATFSDWFIKKFADKKCTVIFSHQACIDDFKQHILPKTKFLPIIKAIDQLQIDDFYQLLNIKQNDEQIILLKQHKVLSKISSLLRLVEIIKVQKIFKHNNKNTTYFKVALEFLEIFYALENEKIDLHQLNQLDDSNLAEHRLITLEFIKNFYCKTKNHNLKDNILFAESFANYLRITFSELIDKYCLTQPLIIAGSSGSIDSTLQLIGSIAKQKHGYVVLYGLSQEKLIELPLPNHPQYFLRRILQKHNIQHSDVIDIADSNNDLTEIVLQKLFLPAKQTITWQKDENLANFLATKAKHNQLKVIECSNYFAESDFIYQKIIHNPDKKIGVVVYDENFLSFLTLNLKQKHIVFNNKIAQNAKNHPIFSFIFLLYQIVNENFNAYTLSSLLHHQLFKVDKNLLYWLELFVLRQPIIAKNLNELVNFLADDIYEKSFHHQQFCKTNKEKFTPEMLENIIDFLQNLANNLPKETSLESYLNSFIKITNQNFSDIFNNDENIKKFIEELLILNYQIQNLDELKCIIGNLSYFPDKSKESNITILSHLEARLLTFDILIIANANESFLPQTQDGGLIGNKIKTDLNINLTQKRFGQSAFDFCSYFQQKQVFFTYSNTDSNNKITKISPFLLKLRVLIQKLSPHLLELIFIQHHLTKPNLPYEPNKKPEVKVTNFYKPRQFSARDLHKLTNNSYYFYIEKILKLNILSNFNDLNTIYFAKQVFLKDVLNNYFENYINHNRDLAKKLSFYFLDTGNILLNQLWIEQILENIHQEINKNYKNYHFKTKQQIFFNHGNLQFTDKIDLIISDNINHQLIKYNTKSASEKDLEILNYQYLFYIQNYPNNLVKKYIWKLSYFNTQIKEEKHQTTLKDLEELMHKFMQEDYLFTYQQSKLNHYKNFTRQQEWQCQQSNEDLE